MHQPYTYLIKHTPTNRIYYGLRYAKSCNPSDLWVTYFTSSKDVKLLIGEWGKDSFTFEIRRVFDSAVKAIEWEKKVLRRMNVIRRDDFINRSIPGSSMFSHSEETIQKLRKPKSPRTAEHSKNLSKSLKGKKKPKWDTERKEKMSRRRKGDNRNHVGERHWNFGKTTSEETKSKISKSQKKKRWMTNLEFSVFVEETEFEYYLEKGFTFGRGSNKLKSPIEKG